MYSFLHALLSDKKGGEIFTCFGLWHFCYILLTVAVTATLFFVLKKKDRGTREKALTRCISFVFALYILDFFLMPFAYEQIDIEKLPFHVCTAMCVACFLSRHTRFFGRFRLNFALLGFISNLVYLIYPAGVMWHAVHPLSYRVVQTLLFHGAMTAYGFLSLAFDPEGLSWRTCPKDLLTVVLMTVWAILGNALYTGSAGSYSHNFNWFFVTQDPFQLLDARIAPFVMPVIDVAVFFAAEMLVYCILFALHRPSRSARGVD